MKKTLLRFWTKQFLVAAAVLVLLKLALVLVTVFGQDQLSRETPTYTILKSLLFYGSDLLGAALLASAIGLLALPFLYRPATHPIAGALALGLQLVHAFFGLVSFFFLTFQGGPLNKQSLDLLLFNSANNTGYWNAGLVESLEGFVGLPTCLFALVVMLSPLLAWALVPRLVQRLEGRLARVCRLVCVAWMVLTVGLVPVLVSGRLGGFRLLTLGLEHSFLVDLLESYVEPEVSKLLVPHALPPDPFRADLATLGGQPKTAAPPLAGAVPQRTNLVFITLESASSRYVDLPETPMPFVLSLGTRPGGVAFKKHYANWTLTSKALFSLFSSEPNHPTFKPESILNPAMPCATLSSELHDAGYFTAFISGQDLAYERQRRFFASRKLDLILDNQNMPAVEERWTMGWGLDDRLVVRNLLEVIEQHQRQPFFVFFMMTAGHHPYNASRDHIANPLPTREAAYNRAQGFADDRVREILEGLDRLGLGDNTLVVIVSDHGEGHGRYAGRNALEPLVKVPLILLGPQLKGVSGPVLAQTSHLDLAPTVLALLGFTVPCAMKGRDLTRDGSPRLAFFGGRPPRFQFGLVDGPWKFILEDGYLEMLFDLNADPLEDRNLAASRPDLVAEYRKALDAFGVYSENLIENYAQFLADTPCGSSISNSPRQAPQN